MLGHRAALLLLATTFAAWGCSDQPTSSTGGGPVVTLSAERSLTDTVRAPWVRLTAIVQGSDGRPVRDARVVFRVLSASGPNVISLTSIDSSAPNWDVEVMTDSRGAAEALVRHDMEAGEGWVHALAHVPASAEVPTCMDSIMVRTTPGQPARILITPRDTALYEGNSATISAVAADQFGNPRSEIAQLEAATTGLSVDGSTVTATTGPSRQTLRARYGEIVDSSRISIVPHGVIAVRIKRLAEPDHQYLLATMELDGSDYRFLLNRDTEGPFGASGVEWGHTGDYLLLFGGAPRSALYKMMLDGAPTELFPTVAADQYAWQQETLDGSWLYFEGIMSGSQETLIYRARPDGSELSTISPGPRASYQHDLYPSPSPDGKYVAYATDREQLAPFDLQIHVLEIATRTDRSLGVSGMVPRWSPTGEWIAFGWAGLLYIIRPDGSDLRQISPPDDRYESWASWSPDGKWLAVEHLGPYIDLINVESGVHLPLLFTGYLTAPSWRPN